MQSLGLSDSTPRVESRWRALFWPTIRNDGDFEYITTQGFWICCIVAAITVVFDAITGAIGAGIFEGLFFFFAGVGVRERSRVAGLAAFTAYFLSALVLQRYTGSGFGFVRIMFLALLFANIRGNWLSARWATEQQPTIGDTRLNQTLGDKFSDQLPIWLWPKVRFIFYAIMAIEIAVLIFALFAPRPVTVRY